MPKNHIANIIFDLGDVLMHVDVDRTVEALKKLGIGIPENDGERDDFFNLLKRLETGKITPSAFRDELRKHTSQNPSDGDLDAAWMDMLLDYEADTIHYLQELSNDYNLYLLSNTNAIHVPYFNVQLKTQLGVSGLEYLFNEVYYSHEIMLRKPDPGIYRHVMKESALNPHESLFIDDREENIAAARTLDINAYQFDIKTSMRDFLTNIL